MMDWLIPAAIAFVLGIATCWLLLRGKITGLQSMVDNLKDEGGRALDLSQEQARRAETDLLEVRKLYENAKAAAAAFEATMKEKEKQLAEQRELLDAAREKLTESFSALSRDALEENSESFIRLAKSTLERIVESAKGEIGKQQESINAAVKPLSEALDKYDSKLRDIEDKRERAYGGLTEQIKAILESEKELRAHTTDLSNALRRPQVRGVWGELTLRRCVELAGMSRHCDFDEQVVQAGDRPDMIVHLPGERDVIVDSKAPMEHYTNAESEADQKKRLLLLKDHAKAVRKYMDDLSKKKYQVAFSTAADFVIMFVPHEAFYAAALDIDRDLIEDGARKNIIIASPTILITLLRAIAIGWREEQLKDNARQISDLGQEIYDRIGTWLEHYAKVGKDLNGAVDSYNKSVRSLESRVLVSARRFKELGISDSETLPELGQLDKSALSSDLFDNDSDQ